MVTLVNTEDQFIGVMDKMAAHRLAELHRAFSVFLFNARGEMLLQKRAGHKYHSPGLWTNSCCSHPLPGEEVEDAAHRRLKEELGIDAPVQELFSFHYVATVENELTENEYDHVLIGVTHDIPVINRDEVQDYRYLSWDEVRRELLHHPWEFTVWFRLIMEQYAERFEQVLEQQTV